MKICCIYLLVGDEHIPLFFNSLRSLESAGYKGEVRCYVSPRVSPRLLNLPTALKISIKPAQLSADYETSAFGSTEFNEIVSTKWGLIQDTLRDGFELAVYIDADIVILRDFSDFLGAVSKYYAAGFQSESTPSWPPMYCTGFMYFTPQTNDFLDKLSFVNRKWVKEGNDQEVFNHVVREQLHLVKDLLVLPESLFQNGLHFKSFSPETFEGMVNALKPFIFHANFVVGVPRKIRLLQHVGLWSSTR